MKQRDSMKGDFRLINNIAHLDPNGGVLVHTTCWRPQSGAPNPVKPGEKVVIMSYHPTATASTGKETPTQILRRSTDTKTTDTSDPTDPSVPSVPIS